MDPLGIGFEPDDGVTAQQANDAVRDRIRDNLPKRGGFGELGRRDLGRRGVGAADRANVLRRRVRCAGAGGAEALDESLE